MIGHPVLILGENFLHSCTSLGLVGSMDFGCKHIIYTTAWIYTTVLIRLYTILSLTRWRLSSRKVRYWDVFSRWVFARFASNLFGSLLRNRWRVVLQALARLMPAFASSEAHCHCIRIGVSTNVNKIVTHVCVGYTRL